MRLANWEVQVPKRAVEKATNNFTNQLKSTAAWDHRESVTTVVFSITGPVRMVPTTVVRSNVIACRTSDMHPRSRKSPKSDRQSISRSRRTTDPYEAF